MIKSLIARNSSLAKSKIQITILESATVDRFSDKLNQLHMIPFKPVSTEILQVNLGKMCNQVCEHCHVDAGPDRKEIMTKATMQLCLDAIDRSDSINTVDLTGGAPEMNPEFRWFVEELSRRKIITMVRSNLTIIVSNKKYFDLPEFFKKNKVIVIASLPCYTLENTDRQRGEGVYDASIIALKILNETGYGKEGSDLVLNLVYNPGGASLPGPQSALEHDYKRELNERFGIFFNSLYAITNLPISRFLDFLLASKKYDEYMEKLVNAFNPHAVAGVMCRNTISVGWEGTLFDCDFNQMLELVVNAPASQHIADFNQQALGERSIVLNQHCYGCTAGAGSSCGGEILK